MARKRDYSETLFLGGEHFVTRTGEKLLLVTRKNVTLIIIYNNNKVYQTFTHFY